MNKALSSAEEKAQSRKSLSETLSSFRSALTAVKTLENKDPEEYIKLINRLSKSYSELISTEKFTMELTVGIFQFQHRLKQQIEQNPVTYKELQSLQKELESICSLLDIKK